jgi:soluble lytic murein transglycosylase-like protein
VVPPPAHDSISMHKLIRNPVWRPLPVAVLDTLGKRILPGLLGLTRTSIVPAATASVTQSDPPRAARTRAQVAVQTRKARRHGAVYRVRRKNGIVLYTNIAALARGRHVRKLFTYIVQCYACNVHSRVDWRTVPLHLAAYRGDIHAAATLTGVDPALLRAVIHAESGFDPRALSYRGAQGLMQLMPATAFALGVGNAFDPAQNISGGARYLAGLLAQYHGDRKLAAAAYNAGESAVKKYGGVPPYPETRVYVKRVGVLYRRYHKALTGAETKAVAAAGK